MQKIVALIMDEPELQKILADIQALVKQLEERRTFLEKQAADFRESADKQIAPFDAKILDHLISRGRVDKNIDREKLHTHIDSCLGIIVLCDGKEHKAQNEMNQLAKFLRELTDEP